MIFLTGATGYVGRHLLPRLLERGERVRCLVLPGDATPLPESPLVEVVRGEITDPASFESRGDGVTTVVHSAAAMLPNPPELVRRVNVDGTAAMVRFAQRWGARRFVYLSAVSAAYAQKNSYGRSKVAAEALVRDSGLDWTILRPTMIYGDGGGLHFAKLVSTLRRVPFVVPIVGSGGALLQPVFIADVVAAIEAVLREPRAAGRTYAASGATVVRFDRFVDMILAELGLRRLKLRVPLLLCTAAAQALALVLPSSFAGPEAILGLSQDAHLDNSELRSDCGYAPIALDVGLRKALGRA